MERILIIGSIGAGKTKLALELGNVLGHPVHHLDLYFHGDKYSHKSLDFWKSFTRHIASHEKWIMDGNYFDTLEDRVHRATHMIWLDPPWLTSVSRALVRTWAFRGQVRADLGMLENVNSDYIFKILNYKKRRNEDFVSAYYMAQQSNINCMRIKGKTSAQDLNTQFSNSYPTT